jgi:uncharacterized protein (DUF2345 family)
LTGGGGASVDPPRFGTAQAIDTGHHLQYQAVDSAGKPLAGRPYIMLLADGSTRTGKTDSSGRTQLLTTSRREQVQVYIEDADHHGFRIVPNQ